MRRLRPYDFRHAFVTRLLAAGGDLKATSQLAGHSRTDTTTRIYQHVDTELYRQTIRKLPELRMPKK
jgi:site-specific recombinase XerD